jgi:hypothetical protein
MKNVLNTIPVKNNGDRTYDIIKDILHKYNEAQLLQAAYAPIINARVVSKMVETQRNTIS